MYKPISTALLSFGMSGRIFHAPLLTAHDGFSLDTILQFEPNDAGKHYPKAKFLATQPLAACVVWLSYVVWHWLFNVHHQNEKIIIIQ